MDPELDRLEQQLGRLIASARRLADENNRLRHELDVSRERQQDLENRMDEARERVQRALAGLPADAPEGLDSPAHADTAEARGPDAQD